MIVRISNEAQYRLDDSLHQRLNELDDAAVAAVDDRGLAGHRALLGERVAVVGGHRVVEVVVGEGHESS